MGDDQFIDAAVKVGELKVMNAFKRSTFVYGTQGKGSSTVLTLKTWAAHAFSADEQRIARQLNLFEPGVRIGAYLSGDIQMMDMLLRRGVLLRLDAKKRTKMSAATNRTRPFDASKGEPALELDPSIAAGAIAAAATDEGSRFAEVGRAQIPVWQRKIGMVQ